MFYTVFQAALSGFPFIFSIGCFALPRRFHWHVFSCSTSLFVLHIRSAFVFTARLGSRISLRSLFGSCLAFAAGHWLFLRFVFVLIAPFSCLVAFFYFRFHDVSLCVHGLIGFYFPFPVAILFCTSLYCFSGGVFRSLLSFLHIPFSE